MAADSTLKKRTSETGVVSFFFSFLTKSIDFAVKFFVP